MRADRQRLRVHAVFFGELVVFGQHSDYATTHLAVLPNLIPQHVLSFGLTSPTDMQISGFDRVNNLRIAREMVERVSQIPGAVDVHLHQLLDAPELFLEVDRERAGQLGLTEQRVVANLNISLSGTGQVRPNFWPDPVTGFPYLIVVQTPPYKLDTYEKLMRTPLASGSPAMAGATPVANQADNALMPQLLSSIATMKRSTAPVIINQVNTQPIYDVYASVERTDLGSVATELNALAKEYRLNAFK